MWVVLSVVRRVIVTWNPGKCYRVIRIWAHQITCVYVSALHYITSFFIDVEKDLVMEYAEFGSLWHCMPFLKDPGRERDCQLIFKGVCRGLKEGLLTNSQFNISRSNMLIDLSICMLNASLTVTSSLRFVQILYFSPSWYIVRRIFSYHRAPH